MAPILKVSVLLACILACGCSSLATVRDAPADAGATRRFKDHSFDQVVDAARVAIPDSGLKIEKEDQTADGYAFLADRGMTAWSVGEFVRVLVFSDGHGTGVRVYTARALATNVLAQDFAEEVFTHIDELLGR